MKSFQGLLFAVSLLIVNQSFSQPLIVNESVEASNPNQIKSNFWYITLGKQTLDSDEAQKIGIEDSATVLNIGFEKHSSFFLLGGGIGTYFFEDEASFKARVSDQYGNESTKSSTISTLSGYIEGGLNYQLINEKLFIDGLAGYQYISSERRISNCSDCRTDDLGFNSDFYIKPRLRLHSNKLIMALNYQKSFSSKLDSQISLSVGTEF